MVPSRRSLSTPDEMLAGSNVSRSLADSSVVASRRFFLASMTDGRSPPPGVRSGIRRSSIRSTWAGGGSGCGVFSASV